MDSSSFVNTLITGIWTVAVITLAIAPLSLVAAVSLGSTPWERRAIFAAVALVGCGAIAWYIGWL